MPLTPIDIYARPLVRALLNEPTHLDVYGHLDEAFRAADSSLTVADVAAELGIRAPRSPADVAPSKGRTQPPRKSRAA